MDKLNPDITERRTNILPGFDLTLGLVVILLGILGGCSKPVGQDDEPAPRFFPTMTPATETSTPKETVTNLETEGEPSPVGGDIAFGYTYHRADGNRWVAGKGDIPGIQLLDIPLEGIPEWLVAAPFGGGSVWVVVLTDGRVQAFQVEGDRPKAVEITPKQLPSGTPPVLVVREDQLSLLVNPTTEGSPWSHPVPLDPTGGQTGFLTTTGALVGWTQGETWRLEVDALPDGRILTDSAGHLIVLEGGTSRYAHGVLGDEIEAAGIALVEVNQNPSFSRIRVDERAVIEGIAPLWADLDGDGFREIIVTQSDPQVGARIVVYSMMGDLLAAGPPVGVGFRWRHPLVVAPFGPEGQLELAVVRTPHIGGVLEYYRLVGDQLEIVAQVPGFSTHSIGSRNLDQALGGDFDGDGQVELILPDQSHSILEGVRRTVQGAEMVWSLPLDGTHTTNLAAVTYPGGEIGLGAGTSQGILRLWLP